MIQEAFLSSSSPGGARDGRWGCDGLVALFSAFAAAGETILYHPNPGNAGDSLIAHASYAFFREFGVRWEPASDEPGSGEGRVVVYGGGGNLVPGYQEARSFLMAHLGRCRALVLLPHTVGGNEDLLGRFGPEVHLFLRESASIEHCERFAPRATIHVAHDMAFGLRSVDTAPVGWPELLRAWMGARIGGEPAVARAILNMCASRILRGSLDGQARPKSCVLDAFRTDSESAGGLLPPGNRDLSKAFELGDMSPKRASLSARLLVSWLKGASLVRTDRLHVAIACCLTGVPVEIHANATHKVRGVFEHSIAGRYPFARWAGST